MGCGNSKQAIANREKLFAERNAQMNQKVAAAEVQLQKAMQNERNLQAETQRIAAQAVTAEAEHARVQEAHHAWTEAQNAEIQEGENRLPERTMHMVTEAQVASTEAMAAKARCDGFTKNPWLTEAGELDEERPWETLGFTAQSIAASLNGGSRPTEEMFDIQPSILSRSSCGSTADLQAAAASPRATGPLEMPALSSEESAGGDQPETEAASKPEVADVDVAELISGFTGEAASKPEVDITKYLAELDVLITTDSPKVSCIDLDDLSIADAKPEPQPEVKAEAAPQAEPKEIEAEKPCDPNVAKLEEAKKRLAELEAKYGRLDTMVSKPNRERAQSNRSKLSSNGSRISSKESNLLSKMDFSLSRSNTIDSTSSAFKSSLKRSNTVGSGTFRNRRRKAKGKKSGKGKKKAPMDPVELVEKLTRQATDFGVERDALHEKLQMAYDKDPNGKKVRIMNKKIAALNKKISQTNMKKYNARQQMMSAQRKEMGL